MKEQILIELSALITKAGKGDVSCNHQCGMEIKLFDGIFKTVATTIVNDPKDGQYDGG